MIEKLYVDPSSVRISTIPFFVGLGMSFCLYYYMQLSLAISLFPFYAGVVCSITLMFLWRNTKMASYRTTDQFIIKEGFLGKILARMEWKNVEQIGVVDKFFYVSTKHHSIQEIATDPTRLEDEETFVIYVTSGLIALGKRYVSKDKWINLTR